MSQMQIKLPAISHLVCTQKGLCRCEYRGDYSAAFCVFKALGSDWTRQHQCDGIKQDGLVLDHMLINRSIHTGRAALWFLYNSYGLAHDKVSFTFYIHESDQGNVTKKSEKYSHKCLMLFFAIFIMFWNEK